MCCIAGLWTIFTNDQHITQNGDDVCGKITICIMKAFSGGERLYKWKWLQCKILRQNNRIIGSYQCNKFVVQIILGDTLYTHGLV